MRMLTASSGRIPCVCGRVTRYCTGTAHPAAAPAPALAAAAAIITAAAAVVVVVVVVEQQY
jgi:hypothetical protein